MTGIIKTMNRRIDISHKTIFFVAGFIAAVWLLFLIREVIILLFLAIIFMSALSPIVGYLERLRIPRVLAIALTYIVVLSILIGLISLTITPLVEQTVRLAQNLPATLGKVFPGAVNQSVVQEQISSFTRNAFGVGLVIFDNMIGLISIAVLAFYMLLDRNKLDNIVTQFFPKQEERIKLVSQRIEDKLGAWVRGQVSLSVIIGLLTYIVLFALGVPYALPLAILAGFLEIIPVIGPIIAAIPAVLIAYVTNPVLAIFVVVAFFIIQQLENHLVVPQVMKKAVGLNPLIVIIAVAIGGKLLGIAGALLAVPITVVIQIITEDILREEAK